MDIRKMSSDEWWEKFNLLSEQQWYEFLKESFNQEIPAEMASENDFVDLMISVYEYLKTEKEYDKILNLQSILEDYNPNLLGQERHYADSVAADIYIFKCFEACPLTY